ncbi:MAG: FMN-binding negative transcriptional regulator [Chitinophagaceae bacterium]|nr:FMN-binding negative transcriptional regulator [Chitinophagaceae bacterium]
MYNYNHYKEHNRDEVISFMESNPFVTLISTRTSGRVELTQVPVLITQRDGKLYISCHVARKSDHQLALAESPEALVLFTGPHCYVSATWYTTNPHMGSTWNYMSVHARGPVRFTSEQELVEIMKRLSLHFENGNKESVTVYDNLPDEYTEKMIKAIVGIEIEVTELDNVCKISQNRDVVSFENIIRELKKQEGDAVKIAEIMEARKSSIFQV